MTNNKLESGIHVLKIISERWKKMPGATLNEVMQAAGQNPKLPEVPITPPPRVETTQVANPVLPT